MTSPLRALLLLLPTLCLVSAESVSGEGPQPLPTLPPLPEVMPLAPLAEERVRPEAERDIDRQGLAADLQALLRIQGQVRERLATGALPGQDPVRIRAESEREQQMMEATVRVGREPRGSPRNSRHLRMSVQQWVDAPDEVTAAIRDEPAELIYRELVALLGRGLDDQQVLSGSRRVSLHLDEEPWPEALTALLGQLGLAWRESGERIAIYQTEAADGRGRRTQEERRRLAQRAFLEASSGEDVVAAEALYRLAGEHRRQGDHALALDRYVDLIERFDAAGSRVLYDWVQRAVRGLGESLTAMGQHRDAHTVYLNYISRARADDLGLAEVYLMAAQASTRVGELEDDPAALDQAKVLYERLLQDYGRSDAHVTVAIRARLDLGLLLYARRDYAAAKRWLLEHYEESGGRLSDELAWVLAECDRNLALRERQEERFGRADALFEAARARYESLWRRYQAGKTDGSLDEDRYRRSAFAMGTCLMEMSRPRYVEALLVFLRASESFRETPLEGDLLVHITRCYAELQREEQTVAALEDYLRSDHLERNPEMRIEQLVGNVEVMLREQQSAIKARVLYYIGQARWLIAERNPIERDKRLAEAIHAFNRVLDEADASPALRTAARLGLGRAALARGDESRGVQALREVLRDARVAARDRAFAARVLGEHYRASGRLAEAIEAYQAADEGISE